MPSHELATRRPRSLREIVLKGLQEQLRAAPSLLFRLLDVAFSPKQVLKKLVLVSVIQLLASIWQRASRFSWHRFGMSRPSTYLRKAKTLGEWEASKVELAMRVPDQPLPTELQLFCRQLEFQAHNYISLMEHHDMYGLMFHLRSELQRRSTIGGTGYARDGNVAFRRHRFALELISRSQDKVIRALRYIAAPQSGSHRSESPRTKEQRRSRDALHESAFETPSVAERLAFINETRTAYGRTALLLSGGAAFGFKHAGVLKALHRQKLLPRIISGTSAGSVAAAACCVCDEDELAQRLEGGFLRHATNFTFFGERDLSGSTSREFKPDLSGGISGKRLAKNAQTGVVLDREILRQAIIPLTGDMTFLEAFDVSGRVLNICVTRSDGKAAPLMCNYLTTPQMLVHSACLASCAIPGVFEAVELMAKNRDGETVPYFKTGGWTWTDGGLQADLPKARLAELFNVNQFIVSQVNPLTPLFVPIETGVPFVTEALLSLKKQLTGFVDGVACFGQGRFVRPFGMRLVDIVTQDYEGDVTVYPDWTLAELSQFVHNFDAQRMEKYELDGERAVWPKLPLIRSLCEIEFALDTISHELAEELALERVVGGTISPGGGSQHGEPRRPSYASGLDQLDGSAGGGLDGRANGPQPVSSSIRQHHGLVRAAIPGSSSLGSLPARGGGGGLIGGGHRRQPSDDPWGGVALTRQKSDDLDGFLAGEPPDGGRRVGGAIPANSSRASLLSLGFVHSALPDPRQRSKERGNLGGGSWQTGGLEDDE